MFFFFFVLYDKKNKQTNKRIETFSLIRSKTDIISDNNKRHLVRWSTTPPLPRKWIRYGKWIIVIYSNKSEGQIRSLMLILFQFLFSSIYNRHSFSFMFWRIFSFIQYHWPCFSYLIWFDKNFNLSHLTYIMMRLMTMKLNLRMFYFLKFNRGCKSICILSDKINLGIEREIDDKYWLIVKMTTL